MKTEPLPGSLATVTSPPIMRGELASDGKTKAGAAETLRGRGIGLGELLKKLRLLLWGHANPGVGDGQLNPVTAVPAPARPQPDLATFGETCRHCSIG